MQYTLPSPDFPDLWERLKNASVPVVMYGMGNGADRILSLCFERKIEVCDFFASDGFVRGHSFHGKRVLSFSEVCAKYDKFIVLLAFGSSLPSVMSAVRSIAEYDGCALFAPDIPVAGGELFDGDFYRNNYAEIQAVYDCLADNLSRRIYSNVIKYKLSGDISFLYDTDGCFSEMMHPLYSDVFSPEKYRAVADLGAYIGDSARVFVAECKNLEAIYALEPDEHSFKRLSEYFLSIESSGIRTQAYNIGAWSGKGELSFSAEGNRNSSLTSKGAGKSATVVSVNSLDGILSGRSVDFIKMDVEGAEGEAVDGCAETLKRFSPDLCISIYHKSRDVFEIPEKILKFNGNYRLFIRKPPYIPAWDVCLCAVAR